MVLPCMAFSNLLSRNSYLSSAIGSSAFLYLGRFHRKVDLMSKDVVEGGVWLSLI